jgi:hypothetical protein
MAKVRQVRQCRSRGPYAQTEPQRAYFAICYCNFLLHLIVERRQILRNR